MPAMRPETGNTVGITMLYTVQLVIYTKLKLVYIYMLKL